MDLRTETQTATRSEKTTSNKSANREVPERKDKKEGNLAVRFVGKPAIDFWDEYLRDPVAKGLITAGAFLTESGRLLRHNHLRRRQEKRRTQQTVETTAGKRDLH